MQDFQTDVVAEQQDKRLEATPWNEPPADSRVETFKQERGRGHLAWIAVAVIALSLIVAIIAIQAAYNRTGARGGGGELPPPAEVRNVADMPSPAELSSSFRTIAKAIKPTVVHINVLEKVEQGSSSEFFGFEFPGPNAPRRRPGTGSGFIATPDGYIMTNNHVVGNADQIEVTLSDSRKFKATIVGTDVETDLAVIRIDATGLPYAVLGNSDGVEQGDWVLALGSPFGLQQTLTAGIVSATGRELPNTPQFSRFIQTDASINPGNSGGPLVSMNAEVIGINTLIFSRTGGSEGVGFAISSNVARRVYEEIVRAGKVTRGYLGVYVDELDEAKARALGVEPNAGVLVGDLSDPNGPAAKAGIRSGDVITAFDGKPVKAPRQLTELVAMTPVGKSVRVDFIRDGQPQSVTVEVAERPASVQARAQQPEPEQGGEESQNARLGVTVQPVTPEMAESMDLKVASGVLVRGVQPGSPAGLAGIRHGDVIHSLGKTEIKNVADLAGAIKDLKPGDSVALQIERGGRMAYVTIQVN